MSNSLSGGDVLQIDGRVLSDVADQDWITSTPEEELASVKSGKNGNGLFADNVQGRQLKMTIRLVLGSPDDKYLNSRLAEQKADFSKFILMNAVHSKRTGDGSGKGSTVVYQCRGGVFTKSPAAKSNSEGDLEQSVSVWDLKFTHHDRSVQ